MNALDKEEHIAFHEAAHCAIRDYYSHPIERVEIGMDTGCCVSPNEWQYRLDREKLDELACRQCLFETAIVCLGGRAVDCVYGFKPINDSEWRCSEDYKGARECVMELSGGDEIKAGLWMQLAEYESGKVVERLRQKIHKLAFALLDTNELNGNQIRELLR